MGLSKISFAQVILTSVGQMKILLSSIFILAVNQMNINTPFYVCFSVRT